MNSAYQNLRGEFDVEESYLGSEVLSTILNVIKVGEEGTEGVMKLWEIVKWLCLMDCGKTVAEEE